LKDSVKLTDSRLEQNRKSAKKCRIKKKAEFKEMSKFVSILKAEVREFKENVRDICVNIKRQAHSN